MSARYLEKKGKRRMQGTMSTGTYIARTLQEVEAELNDDVVLIAKDLRDAARDPPAT